LTLSLTLSLTFGHLLGAGCVESESLETWSPTTFDPVGVEVGKALRAAFPDFDPGQPAAIAASGLANVVDNAKVTTFAATPEIQTIVGIDRWTHAQLEDASGLSRDESFEGYVGSVRALVVHYHYSRQFYANGAAPRSASFKGPQYTDLQATFAFSGQTASDDLIVAGAPSDRQASVLAATIVPLISYELAALEMGR
jgi:hypothetical protein